MVQDRLSDGKRIAQLVASELTGDQAVLAHVVVADADPDVEPTADGAFAYRVVHVADSDALTTDDRGRPILAADAASDAETTELATVYVQPDRARVEFGVTPDRAADAAAEADLRVRPKAVDPPQTLVFVEDGVDAKRVLPVFEAVVAERTDQAA